MHEGIPSLIELTTHNASRPSESLWFSPNITHDARLRPSHKPWLPPTIGYFWLAQIYLVTTSWHKAEAAVWNVPWGAAGLMLQRSGGEKDREESVKSEWKGIMGDTRWLRLRKSHRWYDGNLPSYESIWLFDALLETSNFQQSTNSGSHPLYQALVIQAKVLRRVVTCQSWTAVTQVMILVD